MQSQDVMAYRIANGSSRIESAVIGDRDAGAVAGDRVSIGGAASDSAGIARVQPDFFACPFGRVSLRCFPGDRCRRRYRSRSERAPRYIDRRSPEHCQERYS